MRNLFIHIRKYREFVVAATVFVFLSIYILLFSYLNPDGFLSPDSCHYLAQAKNLLDGMGMHSPTGYFAIWPIGYPAIISIVASLSGLSVFLASKIANIIILAVILLSFRYIFKEKYYLYAMLLLWGDYSNILRYSWSEVPFILGMIWFSYALFSFMEKPGGNKWLSALNLLLPALLLFFIRYIGAFAIPTLFVFLLVLLGRKDIKKALPLILVISLCGIIEATYLYGNYVHTGYITGIYRPPASESLMQMLRMLASAMILELNFTQATYNVFWTGSLAVQMAIIVKLFSTSRVAVIKSHVAAIVNVFKSNKLIMYFTTVALLYLGALIVLRWHSAFDVLRYRLLAPASLLLLISGLHAVICSGDKELINKATVFIASIAVLSVLIGGPLSLLIDDNGTYNETIKELKLKAAHVPENSMVLFGSRHLSYLRPDIIMLKPYRLPNYAYTEELDDFLKRTRSYGTHENRYVYIQHDLKNRRYSESVVRYFNEYPLNTFTPLAAQD